MRSQVQFNAIFVPEQAVFSAETFLEVGFGVHRTENPISQNR